MALAAHRHDRYDWDDKHNDNSIPISSSSIDNELRGRDRRQSSVLSHHRDKASEDGEKNEAGNLKEELEEWVNDNF